MSLPVHSSEEFRSKQQSVVWDLCVCLRFILNQVENITYMNDEDILTMQ